MTAKKGRGRTYSMNNNDNVQKDKNRAVRCRSEDLEMSSPPLDARSSSGLHRGSLVTTLYSKADGSSVQVKLETDPNVSVAVCNGGRWSVPCELSGIEGKKFKHPKIRVHPDSLVESEGNLQLQQALVKSAEDLLMLILCEDWTLSKPKKQDIRPDALMKIRRFVEIRLPEVTYSTQSVNIVFPLVSNSVCKKEEKILDSAKSVLSLTEVSKSLHVDVTQCEVDTAVTLSLRTDKGEQPIACLKASPTAYLTSERTNLKVSERCLAIEAARSAPDPSSVPPNLGRTVSYHTYEQQGKPVEKMLSPIQERVEELRRLLEESIQKRNTTEGKAKRIDVLKKDHGGVIMHIVRPDAVRGRLELIIPPLTEEIDERGDGSPAESDDSGIGHTPEASPKSPLMSPFSYVPSLRQRSFSESCPGLKPILKWPLPRSTFARSISECHNDEQELAESLSNSITFETDDDCDNSEACSPPTSVLRKKRVSFSDTIEQHLFRRGSTIIEEKYREPKPWEKRLRFRKISTTDDDEECDPFDSPVKNDHCGRRRTDDRQDSGFCEEDEEEEEIVKGKEEANRNKKERVEEKPERQRLTKEDVQRMRRNPEESWKRMVRSQRQRWFSESEAQA